ncbi:MAG: MFS transporter [Legionella sp.]
MAKTHRPLNNIYPWIVWTIAASFFFYKYLIQVSPSVMTNELMAAFHINGAGLGNLSAFYFYAYLVMQIPVGMMLDKFSPRLLTTAAILLCSASTYIFSQTDLLWLACTSRALMGMGAAFAAVSCFKLAVLWFPAKRFALVSGMFMTAAMMGAVGGQMPLSLLVGQTGWRGALQIVALIGFSLSIFYFLIIRDKTKQRNSEQQVQEKTGQFLRTILFNKQTWLLSLYSGLAFAPVSVFGGLWGVPFLERSYGFSSTDAAFAVSCIFIGFAIGAPFWGWLSDYMGKRKPILFFATLSALICLIVVIYCPQLSMTPVIILLLLFGFEASGFFTSFAMIRELFPVMLAATVMGVMNTFDSICEALFEPLVGALLDSSGSNQIAHASQPVFSLQAYHQALLILPVSLFFALITLFFIKETHCKAIEEKSR